MSKSVIESLKVISPSMMPPNQDAFEGYIEKIDKALNSVSLTESKKSSTRKVIEASIVALTTLVSVSPANAKSTHQHIARILSKLLSPSIESSDTRGKVWSNTITLISACDYVIPFQQWDSVIEAAFYFKQLHAVTDTKTAQTMEEAIKDQVALICNNSNIYSNIQKFMYWVNIISQFIMPIFWQNIKAFDIKNCRNVVVNYFFSFFNHNLAIPNSVSTLSSTFNPFVNYYTMQLLGSAFDLLPKSTNELSEFHILIMNFLNSTFPCKETQIHKPMADQPNETTFDRNFSYIIQAKVPLSYALTLFQSEPLPATVSLIKELSQSQNMCPQIFEVLIKVYFLVYDCLYLNFTANQNHHGLTKLCNFARFVIQMKAVFKIFCQFVPAEKLEDILLKAVAEIHPVSENLMQPLIILFYLVFEGKETDQNKMSSFCTKLASLAPNEKFRQSVKNTIDIFSKMLAAVFAPQLFQVTSLPSFMDEILVNPVYLLLRRYSTTKNPFPTAFFYFHMSGKGWPIQKAETFVMDYLSTFGTMYQGTGTICFSMILSNMINFFKRVRPNYTFIENRLITRMIAMFKQEQSAEILRNTYKLVSDSIMKRSVDFKFAVSWTHLLFEAISSKNIIVSLCAMEISMRCTLSTFVFSYAMVEKINNNFRFEMYDTYPDLVLSYLVSTIQISQYFKCPHSIQLFHSLQLDPKFKVTDNYTKAFFIIFLEEISNDQKPFTIEIKKILQKFFEEITDKNECLLFLISVLPFYADKIMKKDHDLLLAIIPNLQSFILSGNLKSQFLLTMRTMSDLLVNIDNKEELFQPCFRFMLNTFEHGEEAILSDCFSYFLSNYRRKIKKCDVPQTANCAIIDDTSNLSIIDFKTQTILVSNQYDSNQYKVGFDSEAGAPEIKPNTIQTIGYFLPHASLALLFDALLSSKNEKQYLLTSPPQVYSTFDFINRNSKDKHVVSLLYQKQGQKKIEDLMNNTMDDVSSLFENFLTSIGQVIHIKETDFESSLDSVKDNVLLYENSRHEILFLNAPMLTSTTSNKSDVLSRPEIIIIWMEDITVNLVFSDSKVPESAAKPQTAQQQSQTMQQQSQTSLSDSKLYIYLRPLPKGYILVTIRPTKALSERQLHIPALIGTTIIPTQMIGSIILATIMLAEPQLNGFKNPNEEKIASKWKTLITQNPLF